MISLAQDILQKQNKMIEALRKTTLGHPCRSDRIPPLPAAKCGVDPYHHKSLLPRPPGGIDRREAVLADQLPGAPLGSKLHLQRGDRLIQRSGIPHILQALVLKRNPKRVTENHPTPKRIIYYALYGFMGPGDLPHHILIVRMLLQSKSDFSAPNPPQIYNIPKEMKLLRIKTDSFGGTIFRDDLQLLFLLPPARDDRVVDIRDRPKPVHTKEHDLDGIKIKFLPQEESQKHANLTDLSVRSIPRAKLQRQRMKIHRADTLRSQPPLRPLIPPSSPLLFFGSKRSAEEMGSRG
ncbi:hypothetical protein GW17_00003637 [Ensete ventricosum]|nr:hypothetical protein GW17_00003637 [Ensete ventricosum]